MDCIIYYEKIKEGKDIVLVKKALVTTKGGKVLFDGEIDNSVTKEDLIRMCKRKYNGQQK